VQSVALRLIVDREREIQAFLAEENWTIEADLKKRKGDTKIFIAKLEKVKDKKVEIPDQKTAEEHLEKIKGRPFIVREVKEQRKKRNPSSPFTTSKLQQAAYNQLRFPASKTMRTAQMLYEGVEIGEEGSVGLITYMRTDSVRISNEAEKEARKFIIENYGKEYYPDSPNIFKSKQNAQEAHEAIRPTSVLKTPDKLRKFLTPEQSKLYELIWNRFIASQMKTAVYLLTSVDIKAGDYMFRVAGTQEIFPGFNIVYRT
jgi:DNA topoisomerase-1